MLHKISGSSAATKSGNVKYTYFTLYWPVSKKDQAKSQITAFVFMAPRRRQINKNRDHTNSKVHMQARRKIDNKKKFPDSQIA